MSTPLKATKKKKKKEKKNTKVDEPSLSSSLPFELNSGRVRDDLIALLAYYLQASRVWPRELFSIMVDYLLTKERLIIIGGATNQRRVLSLDLSLLSLPYQATKAITDDSIYIDSDGNTAYRGNEWMMGTYKDYKYGWIDLPHCTLSIPQYQGIATILCRNEDDTPMVIVTGSEPRSITRGNTLLSCHVLHQSW
jgi:hypothetical protein